MRERGTSYNWPSVKRVSITASVNPAVIRLAEILVANALHTILSTMAWYMVVNIEAEKDIVI